MKRFIALALIAVMAVCVFAGCGSNETASSSATKSEATADKTTFTVGFDAEFPPYGYKDDKTGEYTGFDLELAQAVIVFSKVEERDPRKTGKHS